MKYYNPTCISCGSQTSTSIIRRDCLPPTRVCELCDALQSVTKRLEAAAWQANKVGQELELKLKASHEATESFFKSITAI